MSIRRRLMMQVGKSDPYDAMGYVKAGKIFHLDGLNMGDTEDAWTDLVGGIVFENHGATKLTNGWYFAGNANSYLQNSYYFPANGNYTIEVCFKNLNTGCCLFISGGGYNDTVLFYILNTTSVLFLQNKARANCACNVNVNHVVSANVDNAYIDFQSATFGSSSYYNNTKVTLVGKRQWNSGNPYKGNVYAIRIYKRKLSAAEMLHNQHVDNERFNLGLDI